MAKGSWRDAVARALGRADNQEHGVGRGGYSTNNGGHAYNENGITERQQEVLDTVRELGKANAARELGISKAAITQTLKAIGERWGMEDATADDVLDAADDTSTQDTSSNSNAPTVSNPWSEYWDADGNYIE